MAKRPPPPSEPHTARMASGDVPAAPTTRRPAKAPATSQKPAQSAKRWEDRLKRANDAYQKWHDKYEIRHLDEYYEGTQWRGVADNEAKKKYVINLIFATVESQLPSLLFTKPKVMVEARPSHEETATSQAAARATLIEQAVQTFIDDPKVHFPFETTLALRDAYARFALVEVGYSADWIDNPNAEKPVLQESGQPLLDTDTGTPITAPKKILKPGSHESLYVRRLVPEQFRVSPGHNTLTSNDWVAYYEWHQLEDVKRNPEYSHTTDLQAGGVLASTRQDDTAREPDETESGTTRIGMVKVWRIWDLRQKVRHVYADGHSTLLQENKPFTTLPLAVLKFYERRNAFYPLPPIYNWLSPQDEINETREMQKVHRRRALRRYMHDPSVTPTEMEKMETGEDMVAIQVPKVTPPPIVPIQDAPLDMQNWTELSAARDDLNQISGVSGEVRNSPEAPTATQANIVNVRATVRESRARAQVAEWLGEIARLMLLTLRDQMKLPFMVKRSVDPFAVAHDPQQVQATAGLWQQIGAEAIDDLDVDVKIDVASLSPVAEDAQRNQWNTVLQLLTNPALATLLMTPNPQAPDDPSPLLRKTLVLNGIASDQEIREIWRVGQALLAQAAASAQAQAAQAKAPEPMKMSLALKGEDLRDPVIGPLLLAILQREENMPANAAAMAVAPSPLTPGPNGGQPSGGLTIPSPNGPATGVPAPAPAGMQ